MAKAENYTENLTPVEDSNLQKLTEHLLYIRHWARGVRRWVVRIRSHRHLRITAENFAHFQQICARAKIKLNSVLGTQTARGSQLKCRFRISRSALGPTSLHFLQAPSSALDQELPVGGKVPKETGQLPRLLPMASPALLRPCAAPGGVPSMGKGQNAAFAVWTRVPQAPKSCHSPWPTPHTPHTPARA